MLLALNILFGTLIGFALGLAGGGGSLLAVPLLVYGLAIPPREAIGISLAAVGATALAGLIPRIRTGQVEIGTGALFATAGMAGAPIGTRVAELIPDAALLTMFSILMLAVATRMWMNAQSLNDENPPVNFDTDADGPSCQRTPEGKLTLTSRCAILLVLVGVVTGFLSGMFGVGGGLVIVPALVLFSGMAIHRAVATSLLVIAMVSTSGVASHAVAGRSIPWDVAGLFVVGGILGMLMGSRLAARLDPATLQRVFAGGVVAVAIFIAGRSIPG